MTPKINAVPLNQKWPKNLKAVVFCKDCKYGEYVEDDDYYFCDRYYGLGSIEKNDYCSYGELRSKRIIFLESEADENKHSDSSGNNTNSIKDNGNG